jgi:hypothetical protein
MVRVAVALLLLMLVPAHAVAQGEKRVALLIGNQGYNANVGRLKNPHNDIALVGAALFFVGRTADRRATCDQTLPRHARRQASVAFHFGARAADDEVCGELLDARGRRGRGSEERAPAHAAPLMRLLLGEHWRRLAYDAGLSGAPRSKAYGSLHARGWNTV